MRSKGDDSSPSCISIPEDILLFPTIDHMEAAVDNVYDMFYLKYNDADYLSRRVIVCPTNSVVDKINDVVFKCVRGVLRTA
uniref:Uncharacterized protein n=1 Tax=Aegilops tauschii subsp. strangulata TaxID=200361 RepID=A0A453KXP5_AEGTS